ncbi:UDP-N-acetylmuramoyl-tripeptide--D-alanyl-D-alanine ligase [Actinosynnema sp. ALI-1.44]|uniref:UDP-N-acetylmuramoyl-tripeptide--D-alanyl-D- alanine ligase n=1 Tax=Actinosynnema sp. ALI-1.44 TaxID=1933779 RepID=UPI00097C0A02|nr:UDP-N-acetylmuramoyl-tripeptide--D-alanyl-D-alanine ligase [Actinosynnema sp. ALI-1.44]ONI70563.1 UDP-N-acetylmuramoyl-tripeptide--D-alanyl-D-alanine ligase [Actinosynnema sp. ALI-1.44]
MIPLTAAQIAEAVGGRLHNVSGDVTVTGTVEFDSREVTPDGLFVAIPGAKVDGHDFAKSSGARLTLAAREIDAPAVIVPPVADMKRGAFALAGDKDGSGAAVLAALAALARYVAARLPDLTIVGVTGSSGKTSTKDLIAQVLEPMGPIVAPPGSFNNEIGHPWTVLRADENTRNLVLELSARGKGHIRALAELAPPKIGAVLNVGTAHIGEFGSREGIAEAKGELVEALPEDGVAILNADDPLVKAMASRTKARVVFVGESPDAHIRAENIVLDSEARASFRLVTPQGDADVTLALHGPHHVGNALSAAAVALELGATPAEVAERLSQAKRVSARRMDVTTRPDGVTVVNDSYNANPDSVKAALKSVAEIARRENRRTWAVLGTMADLGAEHVAAHDEIGRFVVRLDINRLVVVGDQARAMHQGAHLEGSWGEESVLVPDVDAAVALLRTELRPGDVVLVKASKSEALWRVADALLEDDAR